VCLVECCLLWVKPTSNLSIHRVVDRSANIKHWVLELHAFVRTWHFLHRNDWPPSWISTWIGDDISPESIQGAPRMTASSTLFNFGIHCSNSPILLNFMFNVMHCLPTFPNFYHYFIKWNLCPARWGITIPRRFKKHNMREHLHSKSRNQLNFIGHWQFDFQPSSNPSFRPCAGDN